MVDKLASGVSQWLSWPKLHLFPTHTTSPQHTAQRHECIEVNTTIYQFTAMVWCRACIRHHQMYKCKVKHFKLNAFISALWVKSGNRGNLKCWKVNDHFAPIFHQKMFISLLSDAKLPKVCDWYLGLIIYAKYLRSYLQKTRRGDLWSLKFCVLAN